MIFTCIIFELTQQDLKNWRSFNDNYLSITLFNKKIHSPKFSRIRTFGGNSSLPKKDEQGKSIHYPSVGVFSLDPPPLMSLTPLSCVVQMLLLYKHIVRDALDSGYPGWSSCNTHNTTRLDHRLAQSKHSAGTLCTWRLIPELRAGWCWRGQLVPTMGFRVTKHSRLGVDIVFVHPPCISLYYCENILSNVADINILGLCTKIEEDDSKMTKRLQICFANTFFRFNFSGKCVAPW